MDLMPYCLSKPGAHEDEPWESDVVAKVGDKIFAFVGADSVTLKCGRDREEADELVRVYPDDVTPSAYIGRYGWNTIRLGGAVPLDELRELIDMSYDAIVAKLPKSRRPAG
ncbi:MmcQ/YjbR family DNA-binding protein [Nocardia sp. CDC159]|uniref:MmcQ/YjbR family DNA-binding protein n=1 Tax=Nocardia pulmonis TaxID=2951408 RepID=A0A9X2E3V0_9NOCA|nr:MULTISPECIES: MmcQ/YjbR family DNA-binding protein [Nocardia]MCM6773714.1 MmcQ/YjbR family DNA-binding protein [Nocardia pulmonis]MCM6786601.1 MmcQ/YjbR family DNA-binding protein [Nocardia sp. CDC159]